MYSLSQSINSFIVHCKLEKNLSSLTIKAYSQDLAQFAKYLEKDIPLTEIDKNTIRAYLEYLYSLKLKISSIIRKIAALKVFFNYLECEEITTASPFAKLKIKLKAPQSLPKIMSLSEVNTLLSIPRKKMATMLGCSFEMITENLLKGEGKIKFLQDLLILELLFSTGMRVNEICSMNIGDAALDRGSLLVKGKGGKERTIVITHPEVLNYLSIFLRLREYKERFTEPLFINRLKNRIAPHSIRNIIIKYAKEGHIEKHITPHFFRHTIATLLLERGVDIRVVQQVLGHSSIITTQRYTHIDNSIQRSIIESKHPRNLLFSGVESVPSSM